MLLPPSALARKTLGSNGGAASIAITRPLRLTSTRTLGTAACLLAQLAPLDGTYPGKKPQVRTVVRGFRRPIFCKVSNSAQTPSLNEQILTASSPPFQGDGRAEARRSEGECRARCVAIPR